jgi:ABC-2 type transport system permease protein
MLFIPLLRKEVHWSKRNVLVLGFLLILVPAAFGATTVAFQEVEPENVPVATVAQNENVSEEDISSIEAILTLNTDPTRYESRAEARDALDREEVYAIVMVPPNLRDGNPDTGGTFRFVVDGNIAPLLEAAPFIEELVQNRLNDTDAVEGNFSIESEIVGDEHVEEPRSLAEYLFPTFLMAVLIFFAFTYAPYSLARDGSVLDRLRVESSLESLVTSKLIFLTALMIVPVLVFGGVAVWLDYTVNTLSPVAVGLLLLTFSSLATFAMAIVVATKFTGAGQFINLLLLLGVAGGSAIDFPRGVVSSLRPAIAELSPIHYGMIAIRSLMLKDIAVSVYADMILVMVGLQILGLFALKGSIIYYRRST